MGIHSDNVRCARSNKAPCINKIRNTPKCEFYNKCSLDKKYDLRKAFIFRYNGQKFKFYTFEQCQSSWLWNESQNFRFLSKKFYNF